MDTLQDTAPYQRRMGESDLQYARRLKQALIATLEATSLPDFLRGRIPVDPDLAHAMELLTGVPVQSDEGWS